METSYLGKTIETIYLHFLAKLEMYSPKIIWAIALLWLWILISIGIYRWVIFLFKKFHIIQIIDKISIEHFHDEMPEKKISPLRKKLSDKIRLDDITAKACSYYIFLVFFRLWIVMIGIKEVEDFLAELLKYLPSLFIGIVIGFFGIRFANFVHDVIFHTLNMTKQKTAKSIATGAKVIILFFTVMVALNKIGIAGDITNIILIGFISMLSIAGGLAFGLGWKDIASEILESFRK